MHSKVRKFGMAAQSCRLARRIPLPRIRHGREGNVIGVGEGWRCGGFPLFPPERATSGWITPTDPPRDEVAAAIAGVLAFARGEADRHLAPRNL